MANAGTNYPPQPTECGQNTPDPAYSAGDQAVTVIRRYDSALGEANASKRRCFNFNEGLR